ncbi:Protein FAR1-RELATED SEQUENCE 6 [Acorus gramineus]|uniref:Protein FAR1-RELATED SEQUENCE n=1 Tax=Acorus gramineus TaxID=55184 RepID=A0AAV9B0I3_ACOGR|nr:Protein FAR1-RELATED SEQUENCE 6 [Acorus gramineus]
MEEQLANAYTINMFRKFQDELRQLIQLNHTCIGDEDGCKKFQVIEIVKTNRGENKQLRFDVLYKEATKEVSCICKSFEFHGIVCRHALCILRSEFVTEIPDKYLMNQWRKDFKRIHSMATTENSKSMLNKLMEYDNHYNLGLRTIQDIVEMVSSFSDASIFVATLFEELKTRTTNHVSTLVDASMVYQPNSTGQSTNHVSNNIANSEKVLDPVVAQAKGCPKSKRKVSRCEIAINRLKDVCAR